MLFILSFVVLALAAATVVCLPLLRGVAAAHQRFHFDRVVYRDQLREVDRDLSRGVLDPTEAGSARLEIQRRLLSTEHHAPGRQMWAAPSPVAAGVVALLMLGGATALYLRYGSPSLPDAPFAERPAQSAAASDGGTPRVDMRQAAQALEQKLLADPTNAEGWVLYARTEAMLGDWQKAGAAYRHAIDLGQKAPDVFAGYGEMLVLAADGIVSPAAHDAFTEALGVDAKNDVARYYLALADSQAGEEHRAIERWLALAADLPDDSPIREAIARGVAEAAKAGGIPAPALPTGAPAQPEPATTATQPPRPNQDRPNQDRPNQDRPNRDGPNQDRPNQDGPNQDQMAAAAQMPDAERKQMIEGMVAQLAARLQTQPDDVEGWLRLGRSYAVLEQPDKAADAFEHAAALRPDDVSIKLQEFQTLVAKLQPSEPLPQRALALLQQVEAIAPDQPEALWYLGVQAARDGKVAEARSNWTKLLATLPPDGEDAKLVKQALDTLK
jgi:cytochrome c-type biogenesis protein CcmH